MKENIFGYFLHIFDCIKIKKITNFLIKSLMQILTINYLETNKICV